MCRSTGKDCWQHQQQVSTSDSATAPAHDHQTQLAENYRARLRTISKLEADEEKLLWKAEHLKAMALSRRTANDNTAKRVKEHKVQQAAQKSERARRVSEAHAVREELISTARAQRREALAANGALRDAGLRDAQWAKAEMQEAQVQKLIQKQELDKEKQVRAAQQTEDRVRCLKHENVIKEQRAEKARHYEDLLEVARRRYLANRAARMANSQQEFGRAS